MKCLVVSQLALPHIGGIEVVVDQEIQALSRLGHDVTLITSDAKGDGNAPQYSPNVRVIRIRAAHWLERLFSIPYPIFSPKLFRVLWREIRAADVLHVHGALSMAALPGFCFARILQRPCILTEHVVFAERRYFQLGWILEQIGMNTMGRACARLSNRIVTINGRVLALMQKLSHSVEKTVFAPCLIDRDYFHPPTEEEKLSARRSLAWDSRPKVLFIGRLIEDKGIFLLLQAKDPDYDLVYCGAGKESVHNRLVAEGATVLGPRKKDGIRQLYYASDLVVLPSCREGFPLIAKEALACGLKVILSDDIGYDRYRDLPGLSFCARTPHGIRGAILHRLNSEIPPDTTNRADDYDSKQWMARIYGGLGLKITS